MEEQEKSAMASQSSHRRKVLQSMFNLFEQVLQPYASQSSHRRKVLQRLSSSLITGFPGWRLNRLIDASYYKGTLYSAWQLRGLSKVSIVSSTQGTTKSLQD